jgi:D-glycero-alpha-D-manno-heptose-7-phosphate kinase
MIIRSKAPLRLGLAGGGTDLSPYCDNYGGYVLNATIDLYTYCTIEPTSDDKIVFIAPDRNEEFTCDLTNELEISGELILHKGIYNHIVKEFNSNEPLSFKMVTYSDAPAGSGLGSSSSMVVAILKAYVKWLRLPLGDYDLAYLAYIIERQEVGMLGGKQDQYAAAFGGFNFMEFYCNDRVIINPLRINRWIINELESSLVLFYTGVSRESENIISEQVESVIFDSKECVEAMNSIKESALKMKESILKGDFKLFSDCLIEGWKAKKRTSKSVSNRLIDEIYEDVMNRGGIGGKISGAGGGGFMMFLINPVRKVEVIEVLKRYNDYVRNVHFSFVGAEGWIKI